VLVSDIHFVVINPEKLMEHSFVCPRSDQWSDHVFFALSDDQNSLFVLGIVAWFFKQFIFQFDGN